MESISTCYYGTKRWDVKKLKITIDKVDKIYSIIIYINIVLLNILIGSTHEEPRTILETIIILEALIYIIINKFKKTKNILIKGKIDIAVLAMAVTTAIPLILKTYCSLSDTIDTCIEYLTIYSMYIMVRNVITTAKRKNILINTILVSSTAIIIFGIDRLNFNIFQKFYDFAKLPQIKDWRMTSTIGYSNAVFTYISALMLIALGKYLQKDNSKIAGLYAIYIQLAMYAFYYSNSRAGMVIFAIIFILYLACVKSANKILQSILIILVTYAQVVIFDRIKTSNYTVIMIWTEIFISLVIAYVLGLICLKINKKINIKTSKKTIIIILAILICSSCIYILIAKKFSTPLKMNSEYDSRTIYTLKAEKEYNFKIEYTFESTEPINIKFMQIDNKRNKQILYETTSNKCGENIVTEFSIKTGDVDYAMLEFYTSKDRKLIFNKIYINGKEEVVNYKYLPNDLMRLIQTFNFKNISISERLSMYRSGLKLFALHPIVGNGAKTYGNMYSKVREYAYQTKEVHNFYLDIMMDYGIIGIIVFLAIIVITIYNFFKMSDKNNILNKSIFIAWMLIAIHTAVDFDLAYLVTIVNFYLIIALICEEDKNIKYSCRITENIISMIITVALLLNFTRIYGEMLYKKQKYDEALKYIPYFKKNTFQYIMENSEEINGKYNNIDGIIYYLSKEKNDNQFFLIKQLYKESIKLIKNGNVEDGKKGIQKINSMIENDEILVVHDVVLKDEWKVFENKLEKEKI